MKPILYDETEKEFTSNGIGILSDAVSGYVTRELNGSYELAMRYPVQGIHFAQIAQRKIILAKAGPEAGKQPFRIYRVTKPMSGTVTVYARHIAYDMMGIAVSPFSAGNVAEAMAKMQANVVGDCPFAFYTDKSTEADMQITVPTAMWSLLGGTEGSILDCYGGEYEFDRWNVRLWNAIGEDRGVSIRYGKNLTSLQQDENCAGCYTAVYPYWLSADGEYVELPEKVVQAEGTFSYSRILPLDLSSEWEEAPTEDQLRARAKKYASDNDISTPTVSWKIEFVQLEQTEEYKGKALLEQVMLGDTVAVEFAEMGVSASARVSEICYDSILERYDSVTLGSVQASLADIIVNQQKELETKTSSKKVNMSVQVLTAAILGAKGGSARLLDDDGDGMPDTLYIADNADQDAAKKVWRFNYEGWGGSTNGYDGPFTIGATIGGGFIADWITAGKLSSVYGESYFDLDAGKIVTNDITATGGTIGGCVIKDGELQIGRANIAEKLTAEDIDATNIQVEAANITGKLSAAQIDTTELKVSAVNITDTLAVKDTAGNTLLSAGNKAVTLAGWKADKNSLYTGNSFADAECFFCTGSETSMSIGGSDDIAGWMIKAGSDFGVTDTGAFYASDGHLTGTVDARKGKIGNWEISEDGYLEGHGTENVIRQYPKGRKFACNDGTTAAFFYVIFDSGGAVPIGGLTATGWQSITS